MPNSNTTIKDQFQRDHKTRRLRYFSEWYYTKTHIFYIRHSKGHDLVNQTNE